MSARVVRYPPDAAAVIDVTAPPYGLDNTGSRDCTAGLIRIIDDVLRPELAGMARVREKLLADPDENARVGFESRKVDGHVRIIFPEHLPPQRIIYFPDGTYLVSDTISYTFERFQNTVGNELNRGLRLIGESRDGVRIKLADHCAGFGVGAGRPVISFQRGRRSNIAMSNYLENLTVDVGAGNPGAIGVVFFANNTGAVRHVTITSGDQEGRGDTGLAILHELASGLYVNDVAVHGFDYGIRVEPMRMYTVFEDITVDGQRDAGFSVGNTITSVRGLRSRNRVPALVTRGPLAHVVLVDGECDYVASAQPPPPPGGPHHPALNLELGVVHVRNVRTQGYRCAVTRHRRVEVPDGHVAEYGTHPGHVLFDGAAPATLNLPVERTPDVPWELEAKHWVSVNACGARGDGVADDTAAIQAAMDSGAPVVYFQPGRYLIDGTVSIPATVQRVNFMFVDLVAGARLREQAGAGAFRVAEYNTSPLVIEDLFAWEDYYGFQSLVDHASTRTLVLSDVHTQTGAMYRNSVPGGKVYLENCCATIGTLGEEPGYGDVPCFEFRGQRVWARQLNAERAHREIVNRGSTLWVLGFKTEGYGSAFVTTGGGRTEVLGGVLNTGAGRDVPVVVNVDSDASVIAASNGYTDENAFPVAVSETRGEEVRQLRSADLPGRFRSQFFLPLYSGLGRGDHQL